MTGDQSARDDLFGRMRTAGLGKETLAEGAVVPRGFVGADSGPIFGVSNPMHYSGTRNLASA
jgi:hypothetical protein